MAEGIGHLVGDKAVKLLELLRVLVVGADVDAFFVQLGKELRAPPAAVEHDGERRVGGEQAAHLPHRLAQLRDEP